MCFTSCGKDTRAKCSCPVFQAVHFFIWLFPYMFSWSSRVVKCDGLFVNLSKHSSQSSGEWNFSPLCGPAEKGTQIALLSRPRQEAIICALLNLLFFFIQSAPSSTPKALQSQMRSCECHCSHMEMHMCPLEVQSTAQVLLFSAFPRPSDQPFRNKPTDNEDTATADSSGQMSVQS